MSIKKSACAASGKPPGLKQTDIVKAVSPVVRKIVTL